MFFISGLLASCTISFKNISTHGTATDLIDEQEKADANIQPDINVPITPI